MGPRRRKWPFVVGGLLLLLVAAVLGGWAWLHGAGGEALVREQVLTAANDALAGKLEVKGLTLDGGRVVLTGVKLYTPEGELVAEIDRVEAEVDLWRTSTTRVQVDDVKVVNPKLYLEQDERGLNLSRAVAAKTPTPEKKDGSGTSITVVVRAMTLTGGDVDFQSPERRLHLKDLGAQGELELVTRPLELDGALELHAAATAPLEAPLDVKVALRSPKEQVEGEVKVTLGGSSVEGTASLDGLALTQLKLVARPEELSAFVAGWPVRVPVVVTGDASASAADLKVAAGAARATVTGAWTLEPLAVKSLKLEATEVNLQELLDGGRPSRIGVTATAELPDVRPTSLTGKAEVSGVWETPEKKRLAGLDVRLSANDGETQVTKLSAGLPGAALNVKGSASLTRLDLAGRLDAKDLSQIARTVTEFTGKAVPALAGTGGFEVQVAGPTRAPGVTATGTVRGLALDDVRVDALELDARLPDVTKPLDANGRLVAKKLVVGERTIEELRAQVVTHGRQLDAQLSTRGFEDLVASVIGVLEEDNAGLQVLGAGLTMPAGVWELEAPTRLGWAGGNVSLAPAAFKSEGQRVALSGSLRGKRVDAQVSVERLALDKLPRIAVPAKLGLAGAVSAELRAKGRLPRPEVDATVSWHDGAVAGVSDIEVDLAARYAEQQAKVHGGVVTSLGRARLDADVPVDALLADKPAPLTASLELSQVDLQKLEPVTKKALPVRGVASGTLAVSGTTTEPVATFTAEVPWLAVSLDGEDGKEKELTAERVSLKVETGSAGRLQASVSAQNALGGSLEASVETPLTIPELRKRVPAEAELKAMEVSVRAEVRDVQLKLLEAVGLTADDELRGKVSVKVALHGSAAAPLGTADVTVRGARVQPLDGLDAQLHLEAEAARTKLAFDSSLKDRPVLKATGFIEAAVMDLVRGEGLERRALALDATLAPTKLSSVLPQPGDEDGAAQGVASASLEVKGTAEAPVARLWGAVQQLAFSKVAVGSARFDVRTEKGQQRVSLAMGGAGHDDLKVKGTLGLPLSLTAVREGADLGASPMDLELESKNLDVGFLSGVTPMVRRVAGRLDLAGTVKGTVGSPTFRGDARWTQGRLGLIGYGDYRDIELELRATNDEFELERLNLRAGVGRAELHARAVRTSGSVFHLKFDGLTERLPIIYDDQLMASTTLKLDGEGDLTEKTVDIQRLDLPRVDVELPDVKRKDLQDLERPPDIVVTRGGVAVSRRVRLLVKEQARAQQQEEGNGRLYRITVNAPRNVWVRSSDVNVEVGLSEGFRVEYKDKTQMFGEAYVLRGRLDVIGRKFEVQKDSQVRFAGPAKQPYVNVTALHVNEREKVKVTVLVVGKGTDVGIKVSSDPPLPEADIYTLLATGRLNLQRGTGSSITADQAASVVGSLMASQLKTVMAKALPIDVVSIDSAASGGYRLELGKYLTDTLYLGYQGQLGADPQKGENPHAGKLELQMTKKWSLEAYAGTAPAFGADLVWSTDF